MPDETLQAAFEIKTTCDEISRKLLRWHWEKKPGAHSLNALLEHIAQRQQESPEYYERMPDLSGKTSWSQLDTTLCMRVLLDPEKDAARPLDLLGNTEHPGAARRACNAVRTARNEAAHASDRTAGTQAAILFNEAVEALEEGYAGTALRTTELEQYYRMAEDFLDRCGAKAPCERGTGRAEGCPRSARPQRGAAQSFWFRQQGAGAAALRMDGETPAARAARTPTAAARGRQAHKKPRTNYAVLGLLAALLAVGAAAALVWDERLRRNNEAKTDFSGY